MTARARKLLFLTLLAAVVAGAAYAWYRHSSTAAAAEAYETEAVARGDLVRSVSANGTLNPVTLVNVGTQVSGTVQKLYVDFNSRVEKGQLLLTLDDSLYSAQSRQSQANLRNAQAALELAQANEARARGLFAKEYISKQDLDTAVTAVKSAQAQVQLAQAQADKDRVNLAYTQIHSPVSGIVVDRLVDVGQTVAASFQTPTLIKIAQDLTKMQIDSSFAEADIGDIRVGQAVRFTVDAFPNRQFEGSVSQIRLNPTTVQNVVTYDVVISVDNADQKLLPGMTAFVTIAVAKRGNVLMVPNAALRFHPRQEAAANRSKKDASGGGSRREESKAGPMGTVYVLRNGKPQPVRVVTGITDNRHTEVVSGDLAEGDLLITGSTADKAGQQTPPSGVRFRVM
ncbi:MAG: efflux RND transporter periplasmic adaptor subunit [Gammaproteobacteria bacterium]|nr:efflux RND transporter periplasmic adaptor subunit [Gammaproteobacteria bacterium]